ncbi:MAG TPA: hypothetical protein VJ692_02365, partial [Nitrospiraceae bacterium]|nr:hypothetical protein [Nitrospiraceae bacterium]
MMKLTRFVTSVACLAFWGCSLFNPAQRILPPASSPSIIAGLKSEAQAAVFPYVEEDQKTVLHALRGAQFFPAQFKRQPALQTLTDPWSGFIALEDRGQLLGSIALQRGNRLPALLNELEPGMERSSPVITTPTMPEDNVKNHLAYLLALLEQTQALRAQALQRLAQPDRQFLFAHAADIVEHFSPQRSGQSPDEMDRAERDLKFMQLVDQHMHYGALAAAAEHLAQLDNDQWLQQFEVVFRGRQAIQTTVEGVTGDLLLVYQAPAGLIVIGGPGPNTYLLDQRFAMVIDVGGDDTYRGMIAAASDAEHGIHVVIDLSGNDCYEASPLGLATGRLGVGLLVERRGDDRYHFAPGSGGAGFAGIGILHDKGGHDRYEGAKWTQGVAAGGLGALIDDAGDDTYTSFGYAIGFGGPLGVGAVLDVSGDDSYQCGET